MLVQCAYWVTVLCSRCWKSISVFGAWRRRQCACASLHPKAGHHASFDFLQHRFSIGRSLRFFGWRGIWSARRCDPSVSCVRTAREHHKVKINATLVSLSVACEPFIFYLYLQRWSRRENFSSHGSEMKSLKIKLAAFIWRPCCRRRRQALFRECFSAFRCHEDVSHPIFSGALRTISSWLAVMGLYIMDVLATATEHNGLERRNHLWTNEHNFPHIFHWRRVLVL